MQRYGGEPLGVKPHIVLLGSCKVGNFVVSTPVLRGLKARFPDAVVGFIGSDITSDFERASPFIDWRLSWDQDFPGAALLLQQALHHKRACYGPVALAVNLDGFNPATCTLVPSLEPQYVAGGSLTLNRRQSLPWGKIPQQSFLADPDWDSAAFLNRYPDVFNSQYIADLFCHLAFVSGFVDPFLIELPSVSPSFEVPELLIHCTTARAAKLWPASSWLRVIEAAQKLGWRIGLVGSRPFAQQQRYNAGELEQLLLCSSDLIDLRGRTSLIELAGACMSAKAVISVDAGPLHIAAAVGTPTLAVVGNDSNGDGASPIRLWLPRSQNVTRTVSRHSCLVCAENRFRNDHCLVEGHPCMAEVEFQQVITWLHTVHQSSLA